MLTTKVTVSILRLEAGSIPVGSEWVDMMEIGNVRPFARQRSAHPAIAAAGKVMRTVVVSGAGAGAEVLAVLRSNLLLASGRLLPVNTHEG
mmetsp:Transcript_35787/g.89352  ORF Transcript_35787/g.89352 Transcript_35787/m.89352 type:complete len:91 (-) Transcript_35787:2858-3130(-)